MRDHITHMRVKEADANSAWFTYRKLEHPWAKANLYRKPTPEALLQMSADFWEEFPEHRAEIIKHDLFRGRFKL